MKFTAATIEAIQPHDKETIYWDAAFAGLGLRVSPKGKKTFFLYGRDASKKQYKVNIGAHPAMTTRQARLAAEKEIERRQKKSVAPVRFEDLVDEWRKHHLPTKGEDSQRQDESHLKNHILPTFRGKLVSEIRLRDAIELTDNLVAAGKENTANKVRILLNTIFVVAIARDYRGMQDIGNPIAGSKPPAKAKRGRRCLADDEIRDFLHGLVTANFSESLKRIFRLLVLTGQRPGEVCSIEVGHIDLENNIWKLPGYVTKNSKDHWLPLSPQALSVVKEAILASDGDKYLFPGREKATDGHIHRDSLGTALERNRRSFVGIERFTPRDLRRTVSTGMMNLEIEPYIRDRILNHNDPTAAGAAENYDVSQYLKQKRKALEAWGSHIDAIFA